MLTLYRRHSSQKKPDGSPVCSKQSDRYWKRCACPVWVEGTTPNGDYIRRSLKTASWERGQARVKEIEAAGDAPTQPARIETRKAIEGYVAELKIIGLQATSIRTLSGFYVNGFLAWCEREGYRYVSELNLLALRRFRDTWAANSARTRFTKQRRLKSFFNALHKNKIIADNPAAELPNIKVNSTPTSYFPREEFDALLAGARAFDVRHDNRGGARLAALILLMRWSGLRITDAVTLERSRLRGNELLLHQKKTHRPVWIPLPPLVVEALETMPAGMNPNPRYFFWSGNGNPHNAADVAHKAFRKVAAKVLPEKRCHPHMLRDTFAVEMLLAGIPLDQVSILLGHSSVTMTEKHYSPFVKARQDQLAMSVQRAWPS